jgi:MFS family permease
MKTKQFSLNQKLLLGHAITAAFISVTLAHYVLFWRNRGVSGFDASLLEGLFSVFFALGAIPLGMIADKFGRKRVLILGSFLLSVGFGTYYFNHGFWEFLFSEILIGLGFAATGCTAQALLVESVRLSGGSPADELRVTARVKIGNYLVFVLGAPLGGLLFSIDERIPFLISAVGPFIGFLLALFVTETQSAESESRARIGFKEMLALRQRLFARDYLSSLLRTSVVLAGLLSAGLVLFQPHYQSLGHTTFSLGLVMAVGQILLILVTKRLTQNEAAAGCFKIQSLSFLGLGSAHLLLATVQSPIVVVGSWLIVFTRAYTETVLAVAISASAKDEERSTILGLRSFIDGVARLGVLLLTGWISDTWGSQWVFMMVGVLAVLMAGKSALKARLDAGVI